MAISKAQQKAVNKYIGGNYDRINLTVPKGRKQDLDAFAKANGTSVNGLINDLLCKHLGMDADAWRRKPSDDPQ